MHTHTPPHAAPSVGLPAFVVERTLGRLGKRLRLLGFDALLESECRQGDFPACCGTERLLLTRSRRLLRAYPERRPLFIRADDPFRQIVEVLQALRLPAQELRPFSRCLRCNVLIEALPREAARGRVPDYVYETQPSFSRCPRCRRVYWRGTHTARSFERIQTLLKAAA